MKPTPRHPELVSSMFKTLDTIFLPHIEIEETRIVAVAVALAESFVRDKKHLHAQARNAPENAEKMLFSPLMLSARYINGSLQITWKEVHLIKYKTGDGRWKKYIPLPRRSNGGIPSPACKNLPVMPVRLWKITSRTQQTCANAGSN